MDRHKIKQTSGITLIALVVTVIILLILAGISIDMLNGDNGIIKNASKAKNNVENSEEKEIIDIAVIQASQKNKYGEIEENNLKDALKKEDVSIKKSGKNIDVTFNKSLNKYKIKPNGEIKKIEEFSESTKIYAKLETDGTLKLRATKLEGYEEGTQWNSPDILKVIIEEPISPKTCSQMFMSCTNLESIENIEYLHTENSRSMYYMFYNCSKLSNLDVSNFDTKNVQSMQCLFAGCNSIDFLDLSNFNTEKVTNMFRMFDSCKNIIKLDLSGFNTRNVTNIGWMFLACHNLSDINFGKMDTSSVVEFRYMFGGCRSLKSINISCFNMEKAKSISMMFNGCINLENIQFGEFNICNVTDTNAMFRSCSKLSDETLNDVLNLLPKGTKIEDKTLKKLEIPKALVNKCTTLSNYDSFLEAGWTTGY